MPSILFSKSAPSQLKRCSLILSSYIAIFISLLTISGCQSADGANPKDNQSENSKLASVHFYPIKETDSYNITRRFAGALVASQKTDIGFELPGKVARLQANNGDSVKKGQLLASLDTELLRIERTQLKARLAETHARANLVRNNLKRQKSLEVDGFASQQRLDELRTEQSALNATLDQLKAGLDSLDSKIRKSTLKAPFDAIVGKRLADKGTVVSAGTPIFRLLQKGGQEARVGVPNRFSHLLAPGSVQKLQVNGQYYSASVITLGADINPITHTRTVRLALPAKTKNIAGELVYLYLDQVINSKGFWVPISGLTDGLRGLWDIYTLVPEMEDNQEISAIFTIEPRSVRINYTKNNMAYIEGDLSNIKWIVADGMHRVVPGQRIVKTSESLKTSKSIKQTVAEAP